MAEIQKYEFTTFVFSGGEVPEEVLQRVGMVSGQTVGLPVKALRDELRDQASKLIVASDGDKEVGFAVISPVDDADMRLHYIGVQEDSRTQGAGAELLRSAEDTARILGSRALFVHPSGSQAETFFLHNGYVAAHNVGGHLSKPLV